MTGETVITLSLAQALMLTGMLAGAIGGVIWWLIRELGEGLKQQVAEKFASFDAKLSSSEEARRLHDQANDEQHGSFAAMLARVERDLIDHKSQSARELLEYKAEALREFTPRDQTVRDFATLHAKIDGLASRSEVSSQLLARVAALIGKE
jgi:hypothetical protein